MSNDARGVIGAWAFVFALYLLGTWIGSVLL